MLVAPLTMKPIRHRDDGGRRHDKQKSRVVIRSDSGPLRGPTQAGRGVTRGLGVGAAVSVTSRTSAPSGAVALGGGTELPDL